MKQKGKPTNIAIEGAIKGAYNNVNREKRLDRIFLRIKDKAFTEVLRTFVDIDIMERNNGTLKKDQGVPIITFIGFP